MIRGLPRFVNGLGNVCSEAHGPENPEAYWGEKGDGSMPDSLQDLLDSDREAAAYFQSLPMFVQDQIRAKPGAAQTREQLASLANNLARDGLRLPQYQSVFEDETDSNIDLQ